MRVLVVHCHPCPGSFSAALRDAVVAGLAAARHTIELRDLYAEGFDPVLSTRQRTIYFDTAENGTGLHDHIASLQQCDALVLVYPTLWFGMPAMLKGWFDRIWLPGVAFQLGGVTVLQPLPRNIRRIGVVTTYGSPWWLLWWVGWPDRRVVKRGFKPLCARKCDVDWIGLTNMDADRPDRRARFLARVTARFSAWR